MSKLSMSQESIVVADTLSRNPLQDRSTSDTDHDVKAYVQVVTSSRLVTGDRLDTIRKAISQDADLQAVVCYTHTG